MDGGKRILGNGLQAGDIAAKTTEMARKVDRHLMSMHPDDDHL